MSQHVYTSAPGDNGRVRVTMGFDRPLQGFFMTAEALKEETVEALASQPDAGDDEDDEEEGFLYSNMADVALLSSYGYSSSLDHFIAKLEKLDIKVPERMIAEVHADMDGNVGNRVVYWDADGNMDEKLAASDRQR